MHFQTDGDMVIDWSDLQNTVLQLVPQRESEPPSGGRKTSYPSASWCHGQATASNAVTNALHRDGGHERVQDTECAIERNSGCILDGDPAFASANDDLGLILVPAEEQLRDPYFGRQVYSVMTDSFGTVKRIYVDKNNLRRVYFVKFESGDLEPFDCHEIEGYLCDPTDA